MFSIDLPSDVNLSIGEERYHQYANYLERIYNSLIEMNASEYDHRDMFCAIERTMFFLYEFATFNSNPNTHLQTVWRQVLKSGEFLLDEKIECARININLYTGWFRNCTVVLNCWKLLDLLLESINYYDVSEKTNFYSIDYDKEIYRVCKAVCRGRKRTMIEDKLNCMTIYTEISYNPQLEGVKGQYNGDHLAYLRSKDPEIIKSAIIDYRMDLYKAQAMIKKTYFISEIEQSDVGAVEGIVSKLDFPELNIHVNRKSFVVSESAIAGANLTISLISMILTGIGVAGTFLGVFPSNKENEIIRIGYNKAAAEWCRVATVSLETVKNTVKFAVERNGCSSGLNVEKTDSLTTFILKILEKCDFG